MKAFPVHENVPEDINYEGMDLRDYFAIHAPAPRRQDIDLMQELDYRKASKDGTFIERSRIQIDCDLRYKYADAMLIARKEEGDE